MILAVTASNPHPQRRRVTIAFSMLAIFAGLGILPSPLVAGNEPVAGMFLIATRDLTGSGFSESVVLIIQHDENGTMGVVINKPSDIDLTAIVPDVTDNVDSLLYLGGPVATNGIMLLIKSADALNDAVHVFGSIYASGSRDLLVELIEQANIESSVRFYAGHAGWSPGQLDNEINRGSWQVAPASEQMLFSEEPLNIWQQLAPPPRPIIVRNNNDATLSGAL
jgi:putative transcriptional regulator